ncbi:MAG: quercetin 2,3-dioxygenase [Salinicola sp.]|uniref:pirin family protein n=1 Tax=uncultured Salinicola sp. TaxID=1193542 RepID=UPI000C91E6B4|nr:pirin family protein [uncultured Salinicola sp.]MAM59661.1 quercetin 2,3-dioxygenase [Salinicola sp.]
MKEITGIYSAPRAHWVGNGFPVRSLFTYDRLGAHHVTPFLMLDYAGPRDFTPAVKPRGVGAHPHRGFETVTIVYDGEVEHRDSTGNGGIIGPGDVQWMTAGSGIVHEEFHSPAFTEHGGRFEVVQLWVNLAAANKSAPPAYQSLKAAEIPRLELAEGAGHLAVIAGEYAGASGPARTFSPINVWDLRLNRGGFTTLGVPEGHTTMIVVLSGTVQLNGTKIARDAELALFAREGSEIAVEANNDAKLLVLTGEPIDEPVVGYGPFVMNTSEEIEDSMRQFQAGEFGTTA